MAAPGRTARASNRKISKEEIRYLQRLRHALKVDDDTYAAMKQSVGVQSTKDLTHAQYLELVKRIKGSESSVQAPSARTWKPVHKSAAKSGMDKEPPNDKKPLLGKIEALLADMSLPWSYADAIAMRMFKVAKVRWCDLEQLRKVVAALVYRQRRTGGKNG